MTAGGRISAIALIIKVFTRHPEIDCGLFPTPEAPFHRGIAEFGKGDPHGLGRWGLIASVSRPQHSSGGETAYQVIRSTFAGAVERARRIGDAAEVVDRAAGRLSLRARTELSFPFVPSIALQLGSLHSDN
jgi:hypothetical protein